MSWTPGRWLGPDWNFEDFEPYATASHHILGRGREGCSKYWFRHSVCGQIVPRWQRGFDPKTGLRVPPYCLVCDDGNRWMSVSVIPAEARDLLYLVEFRRGRHFVKVGRTQPGQGRLREHLSWEGSQLFQVVEGPHARISEAERAIIKACREFLIPIHPYTGKTSRETFAPPALGVIGDLKAWTRRTGMYDRTRGYRPLST